jgi:DNA-binding LytR/AlgR family response regulator
MSGTITEELLNNDDPHTWEFVQATREGVPLPTRAFASPRAKREFATEKSARIAIKAKGRILFIEAADLISIEAKGNRVLLSHVSGSYLLRESISTMEEKLNSHGFVRIHRSVLVNSALVDEIYPSPKGEYILRLRGGRAFTVTRTYKKNLQLLAQLWIGTESFAAG